ncbi:MAG: flagellin, partial [Dethiosulfovibrio sp.]|nr:flagellin [Dethiosulfovibrio sp.]
LFRSQEAEEASFRLTISDAHNGKTVSTGTKVQAGSRINGIISDGIALDISGDIGINQIRYSGERGSFEAIRPSVFEQYVHLVDSTAQMQIGANEGEDMDIQLGDISARALDIEDIDVRTRLSAARSITKLDNAIHKVSSQRSTIGAQINRLEHTITNLDVASVNLTSARSRIIDADMAKEMMEFTKLNILLQAGFSMSAQANQQPNHVLKLLGQ